MVQYAPTVFNSSFSATDDSSESSVSGAKFVTAFKDHMFYAGMSATTRIVFSQPFDEDNFLTVDLVQVVSKLTMTVTGLKVFRDNLFIFCENRIFKLLDHHCLILQSNL